MGLESLLEADHLVRLVWGYVERQRLDALYEAIKAPRRCRAGWCGGRRSSLIPPRRRGGRAARNYCGSIASSRMRRVITSNSAR